jgi:hypothetical protein
MKKLNRRAALTPRQHRKATGRRDSHAAGRIPATKRLGCKTSARARRVRRKTPEWWPAFRASLRPGLERDTQLMPWLIADSVCGEVSGFLGVEIPARYSDWLDAKAERCYARHDHFRKLMRGRGNAPRNWLYAFMRHWLAALLDLERPDLYQCLPEDFNLGHRLPPGLHPLIRRKGFVPNLRPKPRPWDARRVLEHHRWAWLGSSPGGRKGAAVAERGPRHGTAN